MKWQKIRAHYVACFMRAQRETGATQSSVSRAGGVAQNAVSKLMNNDRKGPSVETFLGAVEGLGLSVSAFFAELGDAIAPMPLGNDDYARVVERLIGLEAVVHTMMASLSVNVGGARGAEGRTHADPTLHDQVTTLLEAAQGAERARDQSVARGGGSDGVTRRRGGAHAAGRAGRRRKFKKTA
jgi:transcriptional regulator with XRE-family HTH domain